MNPLRLTLPLAAYAAAAALASPIAPLILRRRAARGKEWPERLGERLGRPSLPRPPGPLAWLHAVSVGEALSVLPLARALRARRPDVGVLITTGTATSARLLADRLPEGALHQFAPIDTPGAVRRFLRHWRPDCGVFVESELWPNLIREASHRGVRLALASARITERSARGWSRLPVSARTLIGAFEKVLPQDAGSEARLLRLGARLGPRLNLKLTGDAPEAHPSALAALRDGLGARQAVCAVSTHAGEEALIARALAATGLNPPPLLIVAPRHPERGDDVARDLAGLGHVVGRRSMGEPLTGRTTAYVVDTLGEVGLFLHLADAAVMGGAFVERVGGHNPMEPARLALTIVTGPHGFNARDVYDDLFDLAAATVAEDEASLALHLRGMFRSPAAHRRMGLAAQDYAQRQSQALEVALSYLEPLLPS